ncbi:flagellar hook-basal body protein [uncultured Gimesia sp.]|uniref:flagellar hook-basal body protein n=1 Tax=uncultured Gimesia sp. TaxID=1678688 RepID=UPI002634D0F6|nr:flagellar hook-basal body complex protein [uncultured Gimesia sp.]
MRKNFERMIFAVSVCVLSVVLFIQGILYFKDLGFTNETGAVTVAIERAPRENFTVQVHEPLVDESLIEQTDSSEDPFFSAENFSVENLNPVELALSETSADEGASDDLEVKGPELKFPGTVEKRIEPLEVNQPRAPLLLNPGQEIQQTPGPLMPPLNAEPLKGSRKRSAARKDQMMRSIIREHLPHASKEELEIWFEELQGVPHKVASDLLSIRKLLQPQNVKNSAETPGELPLSRLEVNAAPQVGSTLQRPPSDQTGFIGFSSQADRDELLHRLKPTVDALRLSRDVIVNNIANAGTIGFKRSYVEFESLPYDYVPTPASEAAKSEPPIAVGMGSQVLQTRVSQTSGEMINTGRALDIAIKGQGFLQVNLGDKTVLTRTGRLLIDEENRICIRGSQKNYPLEPEVTLPPKSHSIQISETGEVTVIVTSADEGQKQTIGHVQLVCFTDSSELFPRECCLFEATPRSGAARILTPGEKGAGQIQAGALEASNVSISEELEELSSIKQRLDALKTVYMTEPDKPAQADLGLPAERIARPGDRRAFK